MIIPKTSIIILQRQSPKILQISPSYSNTYVYLQVNKPGQSQKIVHINQQGHILWQRLFHDTINRFGMPNESSVVTFDPQNKALIHIDLKTKEQTTINHVFTSDMTAQMNIEIFSLTKIFAVIQQAPSKKLIITYFCENNNNFKELWKYQSKQLQYQYHHTIKKANNHSMMVWFDQKQNKQLEFRVFELNQQIQGCFRIIKANPIANLYGLNYLQCTLRNVWETTSNIFLLVCSTNRNQKQANSNKIQNDNYILNTQTGVVRQSKFYFKQSWNQNIIYSMNMGRYSMFFTYKLTKITGMIQSPIFLIDNQTEEILYQQQWKFSSYKSLITPDFEQNQLLMMEYDNSDIKQIKIQSIQIIVPKFMFLHFLLHLNQDFDDDLLKDSIELLQTN